MSVRTCRAQRMLRAQGDPRARRALASFLLLACLFAGVSLPARAATHNNQVKIAVERVAEGQVVDHDKKPIEGAVVYLEDPKSLAVKSYLTDGNGHFHFTQLAPETDYELWAEKSGLESKHKWISQFSSHTRFDFTLKLDPKGKKKILGL